jgi:hypothetical protein
MWAAVTAIVDDDDDDDDDNDNNNNNNNNNNNLYLFLSTSTCFFMPLVRFWHIMGAITQAGALYIKYKYRVV